MEVKTLHPAELAIACKKIEAYFQDYEPNCIIGIANGGWNVSQLIFPELPHYKILCQRPSTSNKERNSFIMKIIKAMPDTIKNILRIIESKLLNKNDSERIIKCEFSLSDIKDSKILIIDDAIDSGNTLNNVIKKIEEETFGNEIKTGVITVTTREPFIKPTFSIFNNILIRFPWSMDYKEEK